MFLLTAPDFVPCGSAWVLPCVLPSPDFVPCLAMMGALALSDPDLGAAIARVRSDVAPDTYCLFGYEGRSKIVCKAVGAASVDKVVEQMDEVCDLSSDVRTLCIVCYSV